MSVPQYEVFAIRYAKVERTVKENFIFPDPHDGPMPMDYFVWAIIGGGRAPIVVDTGFAQAAADARKRTLLRSPADGLKQIGIDAATVEDVVITHLHYDHAGNLNLFPNATFHLQESEMSFATGKYMRHPFLRHAFDIEDVTTMVRKLYAERVQFYDGDAELAPGITLHKIGGHTMGLQVLRVNTARGPVVVASDASHYYANMDRKNPFPTVFNVGDMLEGHAILQRLALTPDHIVPGHDPAVLARYPRVSNTTDIVALHEPPKK
jgi:glyoxylase-like metal-dependent hydrolase (beta-lactamase superfamily II)